MRSKIDCISVVLKWLHKWDLKVTVKVDGDDSCGS